MPNCYQCGRRLPSQLLLRRRVRTGEFIRVSYLSGKTQSVKTSFGQRVVCGACAVKIDKVRRQDEAKQVMGSLALLVALIALYIWQNFLQ